MTVDIQCSCCGARETISGRISTGDVLDMVKRGWGSCGSALYCPACSASWPQHNGTRPMASRENTFFVILNRYILAPKEETP